MRYRNLKGKSALICKHENKKTKRTQMDLAKTINKNKSKAIQHRPYKYFAYIFAFDSIPY